MTTKQVPARLPESAYLITYDLEKVKFRAGGSHAHLVRAAALVELFLDDQLEDEGGKAMATGRRTDDPVLDAVLAQIRASKPRSWKHWVNKDHKATYEATRERLSADRTITVEEARLLGVLPKFNVTLNDPLVVQGLIAGCRDAVLGGTPVAQLDARVAALAGLVAAVELNTVFSARERRDRRERIAQLASRAGPATKALRSIFVDQHADVPVSGG